MAVGTGYGKPAGMTSGRRMLIGTNVAIVVLIVIALVGVLQAIAYSWPARTDMTSSGINSLSEGTMNLLRTLDSEVRITSLYFKTDLEEEDQQRYRRAVDDLIGLYESTNRSKVRTQWINPLQDLEAYSKFVTGLRSHPAFKTELTAYTDRIDHYRKVVDPKLHETIQKELQELATAIGPVQDPAITKTTGPIEDLLNRWSKELDETRASIDALQTSDNPQDGATVRELKNVYRDVSNALGDIANYGREIVKRPPPPPAALTTFLTGAGDRFADTVKLLEEEQAKLNELKPLKLDEVLQEIRQPSANAIVVVSDVDARIVDFNSVWPPINENEARGRVAFKDRAFKGEERLTSAILRTTHKEQTAVIFVRYGGQPLFMGGMMPGQPPAMLAQMKRQLEDANFVVDEWDLKTKDTAPELDPKPTRTIYVVFKPSPPDQQMMRGQQNQEAPFGDSHRKAILDAIDASGRAMFISGWYPGPTGPGGMMLPIPATYEFNDYLTSEYGLTVDTSALLIQVMSIGPGKFAVTERDAWFAMRNPVVSEHEIVRDLGAQPMFLPFCAPLQIAATPPAGVATHKLVGTGKSDSLWGVKNLNTYQEQLNAQGFMTRAAEDLAAPFDLAAAATKGNKKVVVVSSRDFAADQVAFSIVGMLTAQGIVTRNRNPGNVALMLNSLHWLNDNAEYLNVGRPVDTAVLNIPSPTTVRVVQVVTMVVWPVLALACGGVVWWVRRR